LGNIRTNTRHGLLVADNMFKITALPQPMFKGGPPEIPDATNVRIGGHRFKPTNDVTE